MISKDNKKLMINKNSQLNKITIVRLCRRIMNKEMELIVQIIAANE